MKLDAVWRYAPLPLKEIEEADTSHLDRNRCRPE